MSTEERILAAAADLLERNGAQALTTRAVCQAAAVTAPTLYHHFGDKDGLLRAVVAQGVSQFLAAKRATRRTRDPIADLRRGWNGWIAFAIERPQLFRLMVESARADPSPQQEAFALLHAILQRAAAEGRLTVDLETAGRTIWAASNGVLSLFMQGAGVKEIQSTSDLLFEAVTARLVTTAKPTDA